MTLRSSPPFQGRTADTDGLGLAKVGVETNERSKKIVCKNEQSSVPHIYAIGDVVHGELELTPVAIQAGKLLSQRLFGGADAAMNYASICTTVFTPLEYGCCGLSEEDAEAQFGKDALEVYHQKVRLFTVAVYCGLIDRHALLSPSCLNATMNE